ncbi:hypothetical protein AAIR98_000993 [Elusimicrobium simillimum]|uniref:hypothetical protein n=1 Tax=Elusimicrobium simillimum TaxID=3143438 RepID=UPI003C700D06
MNKKIIIILVVVILAGGAWFGYSYWVEGQRKQDRRSIAEEKQKEVDRIPVTRSTSISEMSFGGSAVNTEEGETAPAEGQEDQPSQERISEPQQPAKFVAQRDAAGPAAAALAVDTIETVSIDKPVTEEEMLSGKIDLKFALLPNQDPTLSTEDIAIAERNRIERQRAEERAKKEKEERERQARLKREREEAERLALLRDPSRLIRNQIKIEGLVGQEVFINGQIKTVGDTVLGATIVSVTDDAVIFSFKGQRFTKKIDIK